MSSIRVRNPVAELVEAKIDPAPRPKDLNGLRFGLYWNMKPGGEIALARAEEILRKRYPAARFAYYQGNVGSAMFHCTPKEADRIAREVDVLIATTAD
jgi:hypothetical protein